MIKKRCIFHIPNAVDPNGKSGSQVRPMKLLKAFEDIGYKVDVIMGNNAQRKAAIREVMNKIKSGLHYDFMYSESSTMPTLLTDSHHLPTHPFMDFGFMKFCRRKKIKVGLFYRDVYWQFADYYHTVPWYQRLVTIPLYKYDLRSYNRHLDHLYLPSMRMSRYTDKWVKIESDSLPPGAIYDESIVAERKTYFQKMPPKQIKIFYVGGIGGAGSVYDLTMFVRTIKGMENIKLTICCRKAEWEGVKTEYEPYLTDDIQVVHEYGDNLKRYYLETDICTCFFKTGEYRNMAMPIKVFEYLGYVTPVIVTKGSEAGDFVEKNDIGWSVEYNEEALSETLNIIAKRWDMIREKHLNSIQCLDENTWQARARQVALDLVQNV